MTKQQEPYRYAPLQRQTTVDTNQKIVKTT